MKYPQIELLIEIVATLRSENGCQWDREQTHQSLRPNMLEEAYEAVDAIDDGNIENLREELGDVLLQVVLHSQIAKDEGEFDIEDVAKEYEYKVTEVNDGQDGVTYDAAEYHVFMRVHYTDSSESDIGIYTWTEKDGSGVKALSFVNKTTNETTDKTTSSETTDNPSTPTIEKKKTPAPKATKAPKAAAKAKQTVRTGDAFDPAALALMSVLALATSAGAFVARRRMED